MTLRFFLLLAVIYIHINCVKAQNIQHSINQAKVLIDNGDYKKAYYIIQDIDEKHVSECGDSCIMMLNYEKGTCLFFLSKYEEAIPHLKKALLKIEKMPHEDCNYLEIIYGIGSCYNHLEQYEKAEEYFRRVIIRNNVEGYICTIKTQTYRDLTELYKKLGYTRLAEACAKKITQEVDYNSEIKWSVRVKMLEDLAESYEKQERFDEELDVYRKILSIIDSNAGKENDEYLLYAGILRMKLMLYKHFDNIIPLLEDIISIGKKYKDKRDDICEAYLNYLEILSLNNNIDRINEILPEAIKYLKQTKNYDWRNNNIYEIIGNSLCESGNCDLGIEYLEKPWDGKLPNQIRSLGNLALCYHDKDPQKSLSYYKKAESQINDSTDNLTRTLILRDIMYLYSGMEQYEEAVKYAEMVAPYIKEIDANDMYASHLITWGTYLIIINQKEKVSSLFNEAKNLLPRLSNKTKIFYYSQSGFAEIKLGNYKEAINLLEIGISLVINEQGANSPYLIMMYHNLGRANMLQHDYTNALLYLNKSKDLQIQKDGQAMQRTLDYIKECESK